MSDELRLEMADWQAGDTLMVSWEETKTGILLVNSREKGKRK
jgi:hypothetical protein